MNGVTVRGIRQMKEETGCLAAATLDAGGKTFELWFRWTGAGLPETHDAFVAAALLAAMRTGGPLRVEGHVSPRLLAALPRIQALLHRWERRLRVVRVEAQARRTPPASSHGIASFFSGGIDSYYSVLKHKDEITHLIFVHGFDIRLGDLALRRKVAEVIRSAAAELNRPLIEVETNLRDFTDPLVDWSWYNGSALASAALLLSSAASRVFIPATVTSAAPIPTGSHPLLDPQWSTETLELVYDGAVSRVEKVKFISASDLALRTLRVCWKNWDGAYNCGRCDKCVRAMICLRVAGVLERCSTFDRPLDLGDLAWRAITDYRIIHADYKEMFRHVAAAGTDPELEHALRAALRRRVHPAIRLVAPLQARLRLRTRLRHLLRRGGPGGRPGRPR